VGAPATRDVAVSFETDVPLQRAVQATEPAMQPVAAGEAESASAVRDKIDNEAKDTSFLNLTSERKQQTTLAWRDVTFTVPVKKGYLFNLLERKTGETKRILDSVSGFCRPGEILFVMGPRSVRFVCEFSRVTQISVVRERARCWTRWPTA
jgi:hypothetical protein